MTEKTTAKLDRWSCGTVSPEQVAELCKGEHEPLVWKLINTITNLYPLLDDSAKQASKQQQVLLSAYDVLRTVRHDRKANETPDDFVRWLDDEEKWSAAMTAIEEVCPAAYELAVREPEIKETSNVE